MARAADSGAASPAPLARFDSLDPLRGARSFRFGGLRGVVRADSLGQVVPAMRAVEEAVAAGRHAAGFVAYEAAPAFDPALATRPPDPRLPLAWFAVYDRREEVDPEEEEPAPGDFELGEWRVETGEDAYRANVGRIRELIAAGDTYQVNYTVRMRAPFGGSDLALYERLRRAQRSAFCAYLRFDETAVVSASPELFFRWEGGELELRPMKGTRPRGRWPAEDAALAAELVASPKERAENLMIVDLLRSDAGRVSEFGSVRVERLFEAERYETVHQLTSTIRSRTRPGATLADVFRALFPCGSVTGAPKVRTSQIIAEVEDAPRGVYTGAVGFASPGEAVFSVAIRTVVVDLAAGVAELGVGSGITFDSDAAAEYRECLAKAAFTRRAPNDFRLLETLLWEPGAGFFLLDGHLARLAESAAYFGFRCDVEEARRRLHACASAAPALPHRVRLTLDRAGAVEVACEPLGAPDEPVRVAVAGEPVDSREPLLYHKTTRREVYERAAASRPDCGDVLLVNERGELTESTIASLVVEMDGARWTPPLQSGLLPGVFRAELLRRGEVRERVLRPDDLARAYAVWLVNSVRRWRRATLIA
ncbi:MAG TPA: aminodeoxychorismate synthase component I [Longimicrobium sp.]|jgi:para-aminobenzoate synthetase/4-amino-4-deoxychorismate lyase